MKEYHINLRTMFDEEYAKMFGCAMRTLFIGFNNQFNADNKNMKFKCDYYEHVEDNFQELQVSLLDWTDDNPISPEV